MRRGLYLFIMVLFCSWLILIVFCVVKAQAEPYLWCGATPNTTKWQIELDGVILDLPVSHIADETAWLKYDLVGLSFGDHFVKVRAGNLFGWSDWFPLAFTKGLVDVLVNPYIDI